MSKDQQKFSVSYAKEAVYKDGLREFLEYRDLGIENATHGQFRAHVVRVKSGHTGDQDMHTTGLHQHLCDFQMFYVLKGWVKFIYDGQKGEHTFRAGDCVLQPAAIVHNELSCSDDLEILEIYSPAVHETRALADAPGKVAA
jgi:mannose-6-phosphate isomerase-like protein (cupin superfamily)